MIGLAALIQAFAALLWPVLAFIFIVVFYRQIADALGQIKRIRKGKIFGQEIELRDQLDDDDSSRILNAYLFPDGNYSRDRAESLNSLLRELGIARDVLLILDGTGSMPLRQQLVRAARSKGLGLDPLERAQV